MLLCNSVAATRGDTGAFDADGECCDETTRSLQAVLLWEHIQSNTGLTFGVSLNSTWRVHLR
jgi:hypothetical protein